MNFFITAVSIQYLEKWIKKKEYCSHCGKLLQKRITHKWVTYNTETGKPSRIGHGEARCPHYSWPFGIKHSYWKEDGDWSFD